VRRRKIAIKTLVSGFSLPGASSSHPASKKSLILRLVFSEMQQYCFGIWGESFTYTAHVVAITGLEINFLVQEPAGN